MEQLTKRILAIVIIAVIGVGIGVGAWYFLLAPEAGDYSWSSKDCPGAPSGLTSDEIIKFGVLGDVGEIQGDGQWEGAYLAAKEINEAGGVEINGSTYYVGVVIEDTDESNPNLVTSRGIAAAERLVYNKKVQFATGGFRSEALLAYQEVLMDNKIPFINTGAATDIFCENVQSWYARYKYFFRINPINSTALGGEILYYLARQILVLNATYPEHDVVDIGILAEDLTWVDNLVAAIQVKLPYVTNLFSGPANFTINIAKTIRYDIALTSGDMNTHLSTLETAGCDIVIPVISAQGGILMMTQYAASEPDFLVIGIDVQSQVDTFWDLTGGDCIYETILQSVYDTNKTSKTEEFWDNFLAEWDHEPLYTAVGSYDAMNTYVWAINQSQSFNVDTMVTTLETLTKTNYLEGASGRIAFWGTHDIVEGYPYGCTLFGQWQANGTKVVIPTYGMVYPDSIATGNYVVAPWVDTAWS